MNELEIDIDQIKTENLKLTTDMKILRNEHQEVLNQMFGLERRNSNLTAENEALKRMIL
jgi:predicted mannosyl-3-phosphoglycerate phosphatase (HAD superfamily)